jgi:hypothetical protein
MFPGQLAARLAKNKAKGLRKLREHQRRALWARDAFQTLSPIKDSIADANMDSPASEPSTEPCSSIPHHEKPATYPFLADILDFDDVPETEDPIISDILRCALSLSLSLSLSPDSRLPREPLWTRNPRSCF